MVMNATRNYHSPVVKSIHGAGLYGSVFDAKLAHDYGNNDLRHIETDRKDTIKLSNYGLDRWLSLSRHILEEYTQLSLKNHFRQYQQRSKVKTGLENNLKPVHIPWCHPLPYKFHSLGIKSSKNFQHFILQNLGLHFLMNISI